MIKDKITIINIIRNIVAGFLIFFGIIMAFFSFMLGFGIVLFGITISPLLYEKTKLKNIKHIQISLPIGVFNFLFLSLIIVAAFSGSTNNVAENSQEDTEVIETLSDDNQEEIKKVEITKITFDESAVELDLKDTKELILEVQPEDADLGNIENIEFIVSDNKIMNLEKNGNEKNKVKIMLKPVSEGECEVLAKSKNYIISNKIRVKVKDFEKIKAEEIAKQEEKKKKEAEELAKKEEEKRKKEAEELAKQEEEKRKNEEVNKQNSTTQKSKSGNSSYNNSHGKAIYITPYGKKYHYDPDCGGKNSTRVSLEEAKKSGRTPCKKCVY